VQVAVFGTARIRHFSLAIISVTVQRWIQVFWVTSVYFNIRNTLLKSGTFLLGHPVYILKETERESEREKEKGRKKKKKKKTLSSLSLITMYT